MKALITGASGFLGGVIFDLINTPNNEITTIGRTSLHNSSDHIMQDLSHQNISLPIKHFDKVIHCAGKAHVFPKTKQEAQEFFDVNEGGTQNLLDSLDKIDCKPKHFILISTVAVYGLTKGELIKEDNPVNPNTPYGISKLSAEKVAAKWCDLNNVNLLILRLPLIAGVNPPGNLGDMRRAISKGYYIKIGNNNARKSIVVAEDIAKLIQRTDKQAGIFHLTDGYHPTFNEIENAVANRVRKNLRLSIPLWIIEAFAKFGDILTYVTKKNMPISSIRLEKITSTLTFDDTKAKKKLEWKPRPALGYIEDYI